MSTLHPTCERGVSPGRSNSHNFLFPVGPHPARPRRPGAPGCARRRRPPWPRRRAPRPLRVPIVRLATSTMPSKTSALMTRRAASHCVRIWVQSIGCLETCSQTLLRDPAPRRARPLHVARAALGRTRQVERKNFLPEACIMERIYGPISRCGGMIRSSAALSQYFAITRPSYIGGGR